MVVLNVMLIKLFNQPKIFQCFQIILLKLQSSNFKTLFVPVMCLVCKTRHLTRVSFNEEGAQVHLAIKNSVLGQGSQTRGPRVSCGPRGHFVRPAMLFGNFQIGDIYII